MACDPVTGICVAPPTVSCVPPLVWRTNHCECPDGSLPVGAGLGGSLCLAAPPAVTVAPQQCAVTISYAAADPGLVQIVKPNETVCDAAGFELAVAVALAKLLGAR